MHTTYARGDCSVRYNAATAPGSTVAVYSMNTKPYEGQVPSLAKVGFSRTILWLHMSSPWFKWIAHRSVAQPANSRKHRAAASPLAEYIWKTPWRVEVGSPEHDEMKRVLREQR
jgi:hypothetical protein